MSEVEGLAVKRNSVEIQGKGKGESRYMSMAKK